MKPLVKDIMVDAVNTVSPETTFDQLISLMRTKQTSHLVVTNTENKVLGMISSKDIMNKLLSIAYSTSGKAYTLKMMHSFLACDMMTTPVVSIGQHASLSYAHKLLLSHDVHALAVVDDDQKLIGIITYYDLLKTLFPNPSKNLLLSASN